MKLRKYEPKDINQIVSLFYNTINEVNIRDYSKEQVEVWSQRSKDLINRNDFFEKLYTIVAEEDGLIIGYGNINTDGYIDHLYVHKDFQHMKIGSKICDTLEQFALSVGAAYLTVHASITAKPFFESRGYKVLKEQQVCLNNVWLINYLMEKRLKQN